MANFTSSSSSISENFNAALAAPVSFSGDSDDVFEDACCICLEPFSSEDPATITSCKHEYHLQCILDWSQRSEECPTCCQFLVLKDPVGQELLADIASERLSTPRNTSSAASISVHFHENFDIEHDSSHSDDSDFDDLLMQHLAAAASRARYVHRRERQRFYGLGPSQTFASASPEEISQETSPLSPVYQDSTLGSSDSDSLSPGSLSEVHVQALSSVVPIDENGRSTGVIGEMSLKPRVLLTETPSDSRRKSVQPEGFSFPDSIKSKWSATSAKYKESILRSTQGFKEKLLARNNSVKELSRGVKREMSAGISGVARMIERLDLSSKRNASSVSFSSCNGGTSNSFKGKNVLQESVADDSQKVDRTYPDSPSHVSTSVSSSVAVSFAREEIG